MNEVLSYEEIEKRFAGEWVLLADPIVGESLQVKGGTLLWHSKDRDEVHRKALELRPRSSAVLYTGKIPGDMAIIL